ncbi:MAG: VOC family protein [Verrucomicrobiales bacterium]|nr:VOC family protein [Verrucomicrobiales bacterium]
MSFSLVPIRIIFRSRRVSFINYPKIHEERRITQRFRNCEEAVEFYRDKLGAKIEMMMRYNECPDDLPPEMAGDENGKKIMHVSFSIGESRIMASDGGCGSEAPKFGGFALSIGLDDEAEAKRLFDLLAEDGKVEMPLGKTFWSPCFGSLTDKFGLDWMISVAPKEEKKTS